MALPLQPTLGIWSRFPKDDDTTDEEKEITKKRKLDKKIILKEEKISANAVKK